MSMHPYHILESICRENGIVISLMAGATSNYTTFRISYENKLLYGSCSQSYVALGLGGTSRKEYDLHDPESISKIEEHLLKALLC